MADDLQKKLAQGMLGNLFSDETKRKAQEEQQERRGQGRGGYGGRYDEDRFRDPWAERPQPKAKGKQATQKTATRKETGHRDATLDDPLALSGKPAVHTVVRLGKRGEPATLSEADAHRLVDQAVRQVSLVLDQAGLVWTTEGNLTVRKALLLAIKTGRACDGPFLHELVIVGAEEAPAPDTAKDTPEDKPEDKPADSKAEAGKAKPGKATGKPAAGPGTPADTRPDSGQDK